MPGVEVGLFPIRRQDFGGNVYEVRLLGFKYICKANSE